MRHCIHLYIWKIGSIHFMHTQNRQSLFLIIRKSSGNISSCRRLCNHNSNRYVMSLCNQFMYCCPDSQNLVVGVCNYHQVIHYRISSTPVIYELNILTIARWFLRDTCRLSSFLINIRLIQSCPPLSSN